MSNSIPPLPHSASNVPAFDASEKDKAYAAGWFDSRGFFRMSVSDGRTPRLTVHIQAGRTNPAFFFDRWGGKIGVNQSKRLVVAPSQNVSVIGVRSWQIGRLPAKNFLLDILPFLHTRQPQVELCLRFIQLSVEEDPKPWREELKVLARRIRSENTKTVTWSD
jgi:hypothetical protein